MSNVNFWLEEGFKPFRCKNNNAVVIYFTTAQGRCDFFCNGIPLMIVFWDYEISFYCLTLQVNLNLHSVGFRLNFGTKSSIMTHFWATAFVSQMIIVTPMSHRFYWFIVSKFIRNPVRIRNFQGLQVNIETINQLKRWLIGVTIIIWDTKAVAQKWVIKLLFISMFNRNHTEWR